MVKGRSEACDKAKAFALASNSALLNMCVGRGELDLEHHVSESGRLLVCQYGVEFPWW